MKRLLRLAAPALVLVAGLALRVIDPAPLRELRARSFDAFQAVRPRSFDDAPVRIVAIDEESLRHLGQWPWPRVLVAHLVERLQDAGAAAIAFDVIFAEPDRTSPARLRPLLPERVAKALDAATAGAPLPDHDAILAEMIRRGAVVTAFAVSSAGRGALPPRKAAVSVVGESPLPYVPTYPSAVTTLAPLADAAAGSGSVTILKDRDAIDRRVPLVVGVGGEVYPSLALEALRVAQGASGIVVKVSGAAGAAGSGGATGVQAVKVGDVVLPTDPHGRLILYDTADVPERVIPAWRVLEPDFDRASVEGRIVFVGATAVGLFDVHATPLHPANPGVFQHALVVEQGLQQRFLARPHWADAIEIAGGALTGGIVLLAFALGHATLGAVVGILTAPAWSAGAWLAFSSRGLLIDPVAPAVSALFVYLAAAVASYLTAESQRREIRRAFSRYLSPVLVEQLSHDPSRLTLGGETREITVAFSDIRGFTTISEGLDAASLTRLMNRYLTEMSDVILRRAGTIDKYIGDAIMAFWNAPVDDPDHARHACEAALEMLECLAALNRELAAEGGPQLRIGIGMATGSCSVGNMGSDHRFDYTAMGDEVNLASRLEGQSKSYRVPILLAESTAARAGDLALLELDLLRVKGKNAPVRIYTLLGDAARRGEPQYARLTAAHTELLTAYRSARWTEARDRLAACRQHAGRYGIDGVYDLYEERLDRFVAEPPPPDWQGVYTALTK